MSDFEVFGYENMGEIFSLVISHVNSAYACGFPRATVYLDCDLAYKFLEWWTPGWIRKCPPSGGGLNSKGNF